MIEGNFEFIISCYLQIVYKLDTTNGEVVATVVGYLGMLLVLSLPIIVIILLFLRIDTLKEESYRGRWGALYEGLKTNNKF